jgi:hypothetical protein
LVVKDCTNRGFSSQLLTSSVSSMGNRHTIGHIICIYSFWDGMHIAVSVCVCMGGDINMWMWMGCGCGEMLQM